MVNEYTSEALSAWHKPAEGELPLGKLPKASGSTPALGTSLRSELWQDQAGRNLSSQLFFRLSLQTHSSAEFWQNFSSFCWTLISYSGSELTEKQEESWCRPQSWLCGSVGLGCRAHSQSKHKFSPLGVCYEFQILGIHEQKQTKSKNHLQMSLRFLCGVFREQSLQWVLAPHSWAMFVF